MTSGGHSVVVQRIVQRLVEARAKKKLEELLEETKRTKALPRDAFRVSGTAEQVEEAVVTAINDGHISIRQLADLVDRVEENGAQHIFLFGWHPKAALRSQKRHSAQSSRHTQRTQPQSCTLRYPKRAGPT